MVKKAFVIFICVFSCVCAHPCYSMFCCWDTDDDEDKQPLRRPPPPPPSSKASSPSHKNPSVNINTFSDHVTSSMPPSSLLLSGGEDPYKSRRVQSAEEENTTAPGVTPSLIPSSSSMPSTEDDYQIVTRRNISIKLPTSLQLVSQTDGNLALALTNVCTVYVFNDYDEAKDTNADVAALDRDPTARPKSKQDLVARMRFIHGDMRARGPVFPGSDTEKMISCLKIVVDKVSDDGEIPVKLHRSSETKTSRVLVEIEDGALLFRVPEQVTNVSSSSLLE